MTNYSGIAEHVVDSGKRYYHENEVRTLVGSLIDHSESEILVADAEGTIINVNNKLVVNWGGSKEDYIGRNCFTLGNPELYGKNRKMFFQAALEQDEKAAENFSEITPEGQVRYYTVHAFPLRDENGVIQRMMLMRTDKTEQARLEKILNESQKMAAIGELSAYIAHEIRNPLFAIGGFTQRLLKDAALDEKTHERANIIMEETRRLEAICNNIMSFAKPMQIETSGVDVNVTATRTVSVMSLGSKEKRVKIGLELSENLPHAYGNSELLQQCLVNLIKNAMEVLSDGGTIRVRTRYAETTVYLEVEDDGPGIPLELQDKVFSPFFSTKEEGTGLGLAMTRKIINECDGKVFLHSRPGSPTVVSLALQPVFAEKDN